MSCVQCAKRFTKLSPELSCAVCRLSFCKKCLSCRVTLPDEGGKSAKVCYTCFDRVVNHKPFQDASEWEPPANFLKRMEALEQRSAASIDGRPQSNIRSTEGDRDSN
uniref:Abscission/NoCut checkpoint regulator n=1 Tax=Schistocephalus solidus TaxID=70667 RepID=A0A0X3P7P2_SCHSO